MALRSIEQWCIISDRENKAVQLHAAMGDRGITRTTQYHSSTRGQALQAASQGAGAGGGARCACCAC